MQQLDRENFAVRQHLRYVEKFADPASYQALSYEDTLHLKEEVAPCSSRIWTRPAPCGSTR